MMPLEAPSISCLLLCAWHHSPSVPSMRTLLPFWVQSLWRMRVGWVKWLRARGRDVPAAIIFPLHHLTLWCHSALYSHQMADEYSKWQGQNLSNAFRGETSRCRELLGPLAQDQQGLVSAVDWILQEAWIFLGSCSWPQHSFIQSLFPGIFVLSNAPLSNELVWNQFGGTFQPTKCFATIVLISLNATQQKRPITTECLVQGCLEVDIHIHKKPVEFIATQCWDAEVALHL